MNFANDIMMESLFTIHARFRDCILVLFRISSKGLITKA